MLLTQLSRDANDVYARHTPSAISRKVVVLSAEVDDLFCLSIYMRRNHISISARDTLQRPSVTRDGVFWTSEVPERPLDGVNLMECAQEAYRRRREVGVTK